MRTRELIRLMPTQYKRVSENNPLYTGHFIPLLGEWDEANGWVKKQDLEYNGETLACPIIAVVDTKFGKKDCTLTITGKQSAYKETTETVSGTYTLLKKTYQDAETTIEADLTIPRFTRPYATFLLTGLGRYIWGIQDVTCNVSDNVGKISFYALASAGSKIIYWMGIHFLAEQLREILRPWIAPSKCSRCSGTGIEPDSDPAEDCKQCLGYKYSGYSAVKYVQRKIGFDVKLARQLLDWDNMTEADHQIVRKFINKCWTQKWWVTPTKNEILRLFAHFYDIDEDQILITERFNPQEPVWKIVLPAEGGSLASPFSYDEFTTADKDLMKYIARSVTPAGVSVFVGFYDTYEIGDMEDINDSLIISLFDMPVSSLTPEWEIWGTQRNDFYNGWTNATDHFERASGVLTGWNITGDVYIFNANDMNRHFAQLNDNSWMSTGIDLSGISEIDIELWVHPANGDMRIGWKDDSGDWNAYINYDYSESGFYNPSGDLLTKAMPDNDYHLRMSLFIGGGHFEATYSFEDDDNGSVPVDWTDSSTDTCTAVVVEGVWDSGNNYHGKVVKLTDNSGSGRCWITQSFSGKANEQNIEYWIMLEQTDKECNVRLGTSTGWAHDLIFDNDGNIKSDDGAVVETIMAYESDRWYHIRENFDGNNDTIDIYIDEVLEKSDELSGKNAIITKFEIYTENAESGASLWFDAVGYDWDTEYTVGDNLTGTPYGVQTINVQIREPSGQRVGNYNDIPAVKMYVSDRFVIQSTGVGESFIDAFGIVTGDYSLNDNWQRLHEYGWGINNDYYLTGASGIQFDVRDYYYMDRFVNLNDY